MERGNRQYPVALKTEPTDENYLVAIKMEPTDDANFVAFKTKLDAESNLDVARIVPNFLKMHIEHQIGRRSPQAKGYNCFLCCRIPHLNHLRLDRAERISSSIGKI